MADAVRERLLDRAVDAGAMAIGEGVEVAVHQELDVEAAAARDVPDVPFQRGAQAEIVEHAGAKPEREIANRAKHPVHEALGLGDRGADPRVADRPHPLDPSQLHPQRGEDLGHVIVQLAREVASFLFLRCHQLLGQLA